MITAKKSLGQNFLVNQGIVQKIIDAADIKKGDIILEIGPGTGILTKELAHRTGNVIAIEKDRDLIEDLRNKFPDIQVLEDDILKFDPAKYLAPNTKFKLMGNIPYYITSHLLRTIFESANWRMARPELIVLMIQKEVAQRIMAKPPDMNILALSVQFYSKPEIVAQVSRGSFRPEPNVDSAVIKLTPTETNLTKTEADNLFKVIRAGFSSKRKKLINNLSVFRSPDELKEILSKISIPEKVRAENLSIDDWVKLQNELFTSPNS